MTIELTKDDVEIFLWVEPEDVPPHDLYDESLMDEADRILEEAEWNEWAWGVAFVAVIPKFIDDGRYHADNVLKAPYVGYDALGGVSYEDETDFKKNSGYYDDMVEQALGELNSSLGDVKPKKLAAELVFDYDLSDSELLDMVERFPELAPHIDYNLAEGD